MRTRLPFRIFRGIICILVILVIPFLLLRFAVFEANLSTWQRIVTAAVSIPAVYFGIYVKKLLSDKPDGQ